MVRFGTYTNRENTMNIKSFYTQDHDSMAGYGGRIGYRYKTVVTVEFEAKVWNKHRKDRTIGHTVLDLGNKLYKEHGFTSSYSPQVDTSARAKKGVTTVTYEYFHNSDEDAERMQYSGHWKKHHASYQGPSSQYDLDPNNQSQKGE